jgi:hypothetical protein
VITNPNNWNLGLGWHYQRRTRVSPIFTSPIFTSPVIASPVIASPILTSPVIASPNRLVSFTSSQFDGRSDLIKFVLTKSFAGAIDQMDKLVSVTPTKQQKPNRACCAKMIKFY